MEIRRIVTIEDQIQSHAGRPVEPPVRKVAALAVIANPYAGRHVEDLGELLAMADGPRPHARVKGLKKEDVKGEDGMR